MAAKRDHHTAISGDTLVDKAQAHEEEQIEMPSQFRKKGSITF